MPNATDNRVRLGRPPKGQETMLARVNIRIPKPLMTRIEKIRESREDGADTAQVIREVMAAGVNVMERL